MDNILIYPAGTGDACRYAARYLLERKIPLMDHPTPEVTHVLLDVPTDLGAARQVLSMVPVDATVVGGIISDLETNYNRIADLLQDEFYLASNAAITADCAIRVAHPLLNCTFSDSPTLVIGWGRIGKCLAKLLTGLGCPVTVAARKEKDLAALESLGYHALNTRELPRYLHRFRLIFNTATEAILTDADFAACGNCVKIDLVSRKCLPGDDVIHARGLPGKYAPESSGKLIAKTLLHHYI